MRLLEIGKEGGRLAIRIGMGDIKKAFQVWSSHSHRTAVAQVVDEDVNSTSDMFVGDAASLDYVDHGHVGTNRLEARQIASGWRRVTQQNLWRHCLRFSYWFRSALRCRGILRRLACAIATKH
jgi:hypothetical protein